MKSDLKDAIAEQAAEIKRVSDDIRTIRKTQMYIMGKLDALIETTFLHEMKNRQGLDALIDTTFLHEMKNEK
jgi:hypothetical protein